VRQLAAIMFADIQGYTALMQTDETKASRIREKHRQVFQVHHKNHFGKIVQYYGDGALSVFPSALEAVKCAIKIQKTLLKGEIVPVRIGLHMGDIVFDETEVYGDGVNLASRIENLGLPGSILLSEKLNNELKNQPEIETISLGFFELKNISEPVEIFAVSNPEITVPDKSELKGKSKTREKTIAVLPFINMSHNSENEYFSDGITEEIINALARIRNLKVTSRTSSFFFKNKNIPITQIGEELGVSVILEGSVRVSGKMIRITAQLIEAENDYHFWSESWDRKMENIFEIQDEISLLIADKLREQFGHFEIQEHLVEKQTDNLDAYDYFLKAKYHFNKWTFDDVKLSIEYFEKAIELDPNHTESLIGLADAYSFMGTTESFPREEAYAKTVEYTQRAYAINSENAGVHYQLADLSFFTDCNYADAMKHNDYALRLKPNYPEALQFKSFLYMLTGEMDNAQRYLQLALGVDPLNTETLFYKAYFLYRTKEYSKAEEIVVLTLENNPKNIPAIVLYSYCTLKQKKYNSTIKIIEKYFSTINMPDEKLGIECLAYILKGNLEKGLGLFEKLQTEAKKPFSFQAHSYLFLAFVNLKKFDAAFEWLEKAIKMKSSILLLTFSDPLAEGIRQDSRFQTFYNILYGKTDVDKRHGVKKPLLDTESASAYSAKLLSYLEKEQPYLNPALSLRDLAGLIEIHPNQLSWLLNEKLGKKFNEFINGYRLDYFKNLAKNPDNRNISIIGLAYESGFNSKTVFNTFFKKEEGITPNEYIKRLNSIN